MKEDFSNPRSKRGGTAALTFLIGGALTFLAIFLDEEGRSIFPHIASLIRNPSRFEVLDGVVLSTLLTMGAVALASPCLLKWLPTSRMMRVLLRVFSGLPAAVFIGLFISYGDPGGVTPKFLVVSPLLTFIGLLLVKPMATAEPTP